MDSLGESLALSLAEGLMRPTEARGTYSLTRHPTRAPRKRERSVPFACELDRAPLCLSLFSVVVPPHPLPGQALRLTIGRIARRGILI